MFLLGNSKCQQKGKKKIQKTTEPNTPWAGPTYATDCYKRPLSDRNLVCCPQTSRTGRYFQYYIS